MIMTELIEDTNRRIAQRMLEIFNDDPKRWTKGAYARSPEGYGVFGESADAVCFCLEGAAKRAVAELDLLTFQFWNAIDAIRAEVGRPTVHDFNDDEATTFEMAMAPLRTIAGMAMGVAA
jgi:hypothetical protein